MKFKALSFLCLSLVLIMGACGGSCGRGDTNANANANRTAATPLAANTDPALKTSIESALRGKGFNNVTVDVTTTPATIRGTVPKGRMAEAIQTAQVANGGKPLKNEMTEQ